MDWQTPIALLIVALTLGTFLYTSFKSGKKTGCGSNCGCGAKLTRKPRSKF